MNTLILPEVKQLIFEQNKNQIWQYYARQYQINSYSIESRNPFVISGGEKIYLLISDINNTIIENYDYVILTSKKPTIRNIQDNSCKLHRWLKHPLFTSETPEQVSSSWKGKFKFISDDPGNNTKGLRQPQMGALYATLSHLTLPSDKGIIVMPTGTGKTETMLSVLIAHKCTKLLVTVPSDSLRGQISDKFITLGVLKEFEIVDSSCSNPIVGILNTRINDAEQFEEFVSKVNVVITTMSIMAGSEYLVKQKSSQLFSHLFVDEAHHSEASTWIEFINHFSKEKVLQFTATPFRNDGKTIEGKVIYNFPLHKAQEQCYYKEIKFIPIREYDKDKADYKIAETAVNQLREDLLNGYDHILMARCKSKDRAIQVLKSYEEHHDLKPIVVYTGVSSLAEKIAAIKRCEHKIIICVNMLGEGFDLPNLKIAAIHDERQSIPITLQFIGRFTRTSYNRLGNASFVTNIAYPPIIQELDELYARNADWNLILPRLSTNATQQEIDFKNYLDSFGDANISEIPLQNIRPALSTVIYTNTSRTWNTSNWKLGIKHIDTYTHQYSSHNENTLIVVLGKTQGVEWGNFETVKNVVWDIIITYWDNCDGANRVFVNTSIKNLNTNKFVESIFGLNLHKITGDSLFRVFGDVKRLTLFNVGARKGVGSDITFQNYIGRAVQDGIKSLEQGSIIKNNLFGVGYKNGEKISIGCSVSGKVWSYLRGNLSELTSWCKEIGNAVTNSRTSPDIVLNNTLKIDKIQNRPEAIPIMIDWDPDVYGSFENGCVISINNNHYNFIDIELIVTEPNLTDDLKFSLSAKEEIIDFRIEYDSKYTEGFRVIKLSGTDANVITGTNVIKIEDFFNEYTPTIWFANGGQLFKTNYIQEKTKTDKYNVNNIISDTWTGVSLNKESQGIYPYIQDSIQYYFINKIRDNYDIIYDDDGSGEIADIVAIKNNDNQIEIHLFHLKFAENGSISNSINNFYQVCGQAQKSIKWKYIYRTSTLFFDHLFRRETKVKEGVSCSRFIKGGEDALETLKNAAKWKKDTKFYISIVQPALSKSNASDDILQLLGVTQYYLNTMADIELNVYASE